ncbi:hypothetical protein ACFWXO_38850 [Kitasatospora sp. NPDC059088]|uniref:hypothetical protein n=1 Tax=Kitasatospora sp. NPDC059088 TaxID=3346722 RepID=UPI00368F45E8
MIEPRDAAPAPSAPQTCPGCARTDQVRSVPAVHLAGRKTVTVHSRDNDGKLRTGTREVTSPLSRALAPAPEKRPERVPAVLGVPALFAAGFLYFVADSQSRYEDSSAKMLAGSSLAHLSDSSGSDSFYLFSGIAFCLALALFATAALLWARSSRELAGRPQAERLWATAWYCARCGTAHFPPTAGQGAGAVTLPEFRRRVWTAGGYGHLVDRYRD